MELLEVQSFLIEGCNHTTWRTTILDSLPTRLLPLVGALLLRLAACRIDNTGAGTLSVTVVGGTELHNDDCPIVWRRVWVWAVDYAIMNANIKIIMIGKATIPTNKPPAIDMPTNVHIKQLLMVTPSRILGLSER